MSLIEEIEEQPGVLARLLSDAHEDIAGIAGWLGAQEFDHVVVAARGTSDNAARYAQYVWGARNGLSVGLAAPSLFRGHGRPPSLEGALVVGISQSGRSPDIVGVLEEGRRQGRPTLAITNDPRSPMAAAADRVVDLRAGPERSVAATKTYTAELLAVAMLSAALAPDAAAASDLDAIPSNTQAILERRRSIEALGGEFATIDRCVVLGRGFNHATAFEWALKLQELCYLPALPFSTADFEHGPVALVEEGFPVFAVAPGGPLHGEVHALLTRLVQDRGADLLVLSDRPETLALTERHVQLPEIAEWLSPIVAAAAVQLFCYALAVAKGLDPDSPRGLQKVTRTR